MRVSAPPFLNPCYYGTDIDSRDHLIACHRTIPEMADITAVRTAWAACPLGICAA